MNIAEFLKERKYNGITDFLAIRDELFKHNICVSYETIPKIDHLFRNNPDFVNNSNTDDLVADVSKDTVTKNSTEVNNTNATNADVNTDNEVTKNQSQLISSLENTHITETNNDLAGETKEDYVLNNTREFIFSCKKNVRSPDNKLMLEANGLILQAPDWTPLVIPPTRPTNYFNKDIINSLLRKNEYKIYLLEDGTIVNLHFCKKTKQWVLSSVRGLNINNTVFNIFSYSHMFNESLSYNGINMYEFYNNLDKSKCYTFGFKHPDLHPFMENSGMPIYKVWFVQMVNLKKNKVITTSPWNFIPGHKVYKPNVKNLKELFSETRNSYTNFVKNKSILYGFLLISKNPETSDEHLGYSSILLESYLMKHIKDMWYDARYVRFSKIKEFNRVDTILLNSFLDRTRTELFNNIFYQYNNYILDLNAMENYIVEEIYNNIKTNQAVYANKANQIKQGDENANSSPNTNMQVAHDTKQLYNNIINILTEKVTGKLNVLLHERPKQKIKDIIHVPENIDFYYKIRLLIRPCVQ